MAKKERFHAKKSLNVDIALKWSQIMHESGFFNALSLITSKSPTGIRITPYHSVHFSVQKRTTLDIY